MNIDELSEQIARISSETVAQDLSQLLIDWKVSDATARDLEDCVERYIGKVWVTKDQDHSEIYRLWSQFRDQAISGIGGMTMNERLYIFGLFQRFESCKNDEHRLAVYAKLHAKP